MRLRQSLYAHIVPVAANSVLLLHAISQMRLKVDAEVATMLVYFSEPRNMPACLSDLMRFVPYDRATLQAAIDALALRGYLTEKTPEEEQAALSDKLGATYGRDPGELLDRYRREAAEGGAARWATGSARSVSELGVVKKQLDVVIFGDCDMHIESDFLRREGAARGFDLRVAATAPDDAAFAADHKHDAIIIGALNGRHFLTQPPEKGQEPHTLYVMQMGQLLARLRAHTSAPILIDNLPEPTVQPLGLAERGLDGHRARFRRANLALAELVEEFSDVHVTDIASALNVAGSLPMVDDWQVDFTHMGSAGWMLQRPEREKAAVHNQMPDMAMLAQLTGPDPYRREAMAARAHMDMIVAALGLGRKKCVIIDLDNTLWPGVLAETGAPFAWQPDISGPYSYIGLFFGLHEALLALKKRGIVLACVSKNDESVVRDLWTYPDSYPRRRLLTLDDFVTHRINWDDKPANIKSIAEELGFAHDAFLFIDDNPIERDRVKQFLPDIEVWGDNPFALRRMLLDDPRLMVPHLTEESQGRTQLVRAQLDRQKFRTSAADESAYIDSLQIKMDVRELHAPERLDRIEELFARTTQFNATVRPFSAARLQGLIADPAAHLFVLHVSDRFGDHGLVGAGVVESGEITGLVLSCRVLGMGVEHRFVRHVGDAIGGEVRAVIIETARNIPVRNIYRDNGFTLTDGIWRYTPGKS